MNTIEIYNTITNDVYETIIVDLNASHATDTINSRVALYSNADWREVVPPVDTGELEDFEIEAEHESYREEQLPHHTLTNMMEAKGSFSQADLDAYNDIITWINGIRVQCEAYKAQVPPPTLPDLVWNAFPQTSEYLLHLHY